MRPTVYIKTYGCQMNARDSEALLCLLESHGYARTDTEADADILLFNTCSVREQAERKAIGKIGLLKRLKRHRPDIVIGVIGCMAQNYGAKLAEMLPHADLIVGTDQLHRLPALLDNVHRGHGPLICTEQDGAVLGRLQRHDPGQVTAFISVMRGCNQFCSYCIVPYVRGREHSRSPRDIVEEVAAVVRQGSREIFLLGQNITAYGIAEARRAGTYDSEFSPFAHLLEQIAAVDGVARIRFTSPHVAYMNRHFIDTVCSLDKVCNAFHVPLQSGSDRILELMNRSYRARHYLAVVDHIRERLASVTFSTDVMVGFPTETEEDFQATRRVMNAVGFDMAYIFRYSTRAGTKAAETLRDDVPEDVKMVRNKRLLDDLEQRTADGNQAFVGSSVPVLVEGPSKRNPSRWQGRSDLNKVVIFEPVPGLDRGHLVDVMVDATTSHSLFGRVQGKAVR